MNSAAYWLEALGVRLRERVGGDHVAILGLPLPEMLGTFAQIGRAHA